MMEAFTVIDRNALTTLMTLAEAGLEQELSRLEKGLTDLSLLAHAVRLDEMCHTMIRLVASGQVSSPTDWKSALERVKTVREAALEEKE